MSDFPTLRSYHPAELRAADTEGRVSAVISTSNLARDGAIIEADGWDFTAFRKNPVLLWAHDDSRPPIGRVDKIQNDSRASAKRGDISADLVFDLGSEFGAEVHGSVSRGFLNATSVRWRPTKTTTRKVKVDGTEREVLVFQNQELLEVSIVPVPADAKALIQRADGSSFCLDDFCEADPNPETPVPSLTDEVVAFRYMLHQEDRLDDALDALTGLYRELQERLEPAPSPEPDTRIEALTEQIAGLARIVQAEAEAPHPNADEFTVRLLAQTTGRSEERVRQEINHGA